MFSSRIDLSDIKTKIGHVVLDGVCEMTRIFLRVTNPSKLTLKIAIIILEGLNDTVIKLIALAEDHFQSQELARLDTTTTHAQDENEHMSIPEFPYDNIDNNSSQGVERKESIDILPYVVQ
ncbi:hypothetical protein BGZ94_001800 [Podila epigama]|nr:hypothetical protein BGZ94_001800 [Podila epigama]